MSLNRSGTFFLDCFCLKIDLSILSLSRFVDLRAGRKRNVFCAYTQRLPERSEGWTQRINWECHMWWLPFDKYTTFAIVELITTSCLAVKLN